jgi:pyruvate formate lyase activating enzyme
MSLRPAPGMAEGLSRGGEYHFFGGSVAFSIPRPGDTMYPLPPFGPPPMLTRRGFLTATSRFAPALLPCAWVLPGVLGEGSEAERAPWFAGQTANDLAKAAPRARYWATVATPGVGCTDCHVPLPKSGGRPHQHDPATVSCLLCAQGCTIRPGGRGRCRARMNVNGELRSLVYGRPVAVHLDPIEKKPFFHFLPGSSAYSIGTTGCPLGCAFCQNWQISQANPEDFDVTPVSPASVVAAAQSRGAPVIAFTYNEATVFTEYLLDIAAAARAARIRSVLVSCGFMNERPLADMCAALDAIKIDLKGFSEDFYRNVSGASLAPVLRSIRQIRKAGVHLELVNLVVPTLNDADTGLRALADWVSGELGPDVPLHFTRFHPEFRLLNLPPTPIATLDRARSIAMDKGLRYVYVGNVPDHPGSHTTCPACKRVVVRRQDFFVTEINVKNGRCGFCGTPVAGVWS